MARMIALVPAAGTGSRFGAPSPKQYLQLNGKPLMWHTLAALAATPGVDEVAVVISPQDEWFDDFDWDLPKLSVHRVGGSCRAESVANGLGALACEAEDWVLVHDAARCCVPVAAVERLIAALAGHEVGGLLALPVPDTVKRADADGQVAVTVPRKGLWLAQTPQMFRAGLLAKALLGMAAEDITDEASAIERLGLKPLLVEGDAQNFKVTYPRDLALARAILAAREER
ncbi:2-C-methyl-D-erythritol 4-phosphate cytidylyltransferase [Chromobacterium phragmitis]|uniref:2-C-methyl-D-erythritol 4-phosphate cytidylyltransferase n=1 Tax=Chromobacterium phragmitis TaxID=2202141 RepID=A0A344ULW5_9NEIS|nr:2-C-methyl-D-erythritol 4-phosphate cytidylyltransferase [Chromobacterium phragmitis]AXE30868.1 2-C-methyl-D-erythritol 4-phosphate cytidylyltransferase [Chromobacterium phragmitis]AXE36263.1 2-C-methyl-D-erythritol 4-phosphate cytidylyltransferase [Chromobacterium phragmitis]